MRWIRKLFSKQSPGRCADAANARRAGVGPVMEPLEPRLLLSAQIVTGEAPATAAPGEAVIVRAIFDTDDPAGESTSGLVLRLHYDASQLALDALSEIFPDGLITEDPTPQDDTDDFDNDPATDRFVTVGWLGLLGAWPGEGTTPLELFEARFTTGPEMSVTTVNFTAQSTAPGFTFETAPTTIAHTSLDVDGDGTAAAATDGLLAARHLFGFGGAALTAGALGAGAVRDAQGVQALMENGRTTLLDADGDGAARPLTDGVLIARHLEGFSGSALVEGALGMEATRTDPGEIADFLDRFLPAGSGATALQAPAEDPQEAGAPRLDLLASAWLAWQEGFDAEPETDELPAHRLAGENALRA